MLIFRLPKMHMANYQCKPPKTPPENNKKGRKKEQKNKILRQQHLIDMDLLA
jgi:hypothetical protein